MNDNMSVIFRPLARYDRHEYLNLLRQLTAVGTYSEARWNLIYDEIDETDNIEIFLMYNEQTPGALLGAGTLLLEKKFIHGGSSVGHIEDIVIAESARGRGLGRKMVNFLVERAKELGAYKVILDCKPELQGFYESSGFRRTEIQMRKDLSETIIVNE